MEAILNTPESSPSESDGFFVFFQILLNLVEQAGFESVGFELLQGNRLPFAWYQNLRVDEGVERFL
jgi:hypothetical protein